MTTAKTASDQTAQATLIAEATPPVELHTPEVVQPSAEVVPAGDPEVTSALERAADAALAMPGIPGRDEFLSMAMQARILSMSAVAPKALRGNPHVAFHVVMIGRDLGISPSAAIELVDVIGTGEDARPSMSPQLLLGQIRRLGLGQIRRDHLDDWSCVAVALDPDGAELGASEFRWEDAQTAGLVDTRCEPREHHKDSNGRCKCRQGWRTYPRRMLWWRAAGYAAADFYPEAGLGLYAPEELGAVVDDAGRPIDPATVELPDGYDNTPPPTEWADGAALWDLQTRIYALPAAARAELAERWKGSSRLRAGDGYYPASRIPVAALPMAESMVTGMERVAARTAPGGVAWEPGPAREDVEREVAVRLCGLLVPFTVLAGGWDPYGAATQEKAAQGGVAADLSYTPEALKQAEADVSEMTCLDVEEVLAGWDGVEVTGNEVRDRARLAALFAARASA